MNQLPPPILNPEIKYNQLFINNEWVPAEDGSMFSVECPMTGKEVCKVAEAKKADVNAAVAAAKKAFAPGSEWRKMAPKTRAVLLHKFADLIDRDRQYIASLESLNAGRLYSLVYPGDMQMCIEVLRYFAGWCDKDHGKTIPYDNEHFAYTRHEPIGVCGAITPWNVPAVMFMWKLAPCIATGNVFVSKPAELAPLSALYLASLTKEAGFPPGVVNVIPGFGSVAGDVLSHHMDVKKIAFTGSTATGRLIQKASAESNLKKVSLELGGKSPNIILPDVDLDFAVAMANIATFTHAGQICCAGSRTFVHEDIYDEFVQRSIKMAQSLVAGDPRDIATTHVPQINKLQKDKVLRYIQSGKDQGCTIHCGGSAMAERSGYYIQPTVLTGLRDDMNLSQEEIFGPVQLIYKFKTIDEVIERANNVSYGLGAGVFTNDINKAMTLSNALEAGVVWINCYYDMTPATPFGGYKTSGIGRDLSEYALREYTQVKGVVMKLHAPS